MKLQSRFQFLEATLNVPPKTMSDLNDEAV
jgi:hypothetical protein